MTPEHDILIVGAGPTGLAAALFLAERGIRTRVVERKIEPSQQSKAFGVNPRTLSLLQSTGVTEKLLERGRRLTTLHLRRPGREHPIARFELSPISHRFPFMLIHSQAETEMLLADAARARGVVIERGIELSEVVVSGEAAQVALRHIGGADVPNESIRPGIVLAADGAHSTVRDQLAIDFPGSTYDEPWSLCDLHLETPLDPNVAHLFMLERAGLFMVRLKDDLWRIAGNAVPEGEVERLLEYLPRGSRPGVMAWFSAFRISHRVASRFRVGCVYLAGDAAHLHSPIGARGMNLGIEDAYVFAQLAATECLESYEARRRPVDQRVVRGVERLSALPRGRSWVARASRRLWPLIPLALPFVGGFARRWLMGLDHDIER